MGGVGERKKRRRSGREEEEEEEWEEWERGRRGGGVGERKKRGRNGRSVREEEEGEACYSPQTVVNNSPFLLFYGLLGVINLRMALHSNTMVIYRVGA